MGFAGSYGSGIAGQAMATKDATNALGVFTLKDRVERAVSEAEARLRAAKRAEEILLKHPDLEELLNLLQQF